jgi:hypothetical protein
MVQKNQRDDMKKPLDVYLTRGMQRTSQNLKEYAVKNDVGLSRLKYAPGIFPEFFQNAINC